MAGPVMLGLTLGVFELVVVIDDVTVCDTVFEGVWVVDAVFVAVRDDVCVPVAVLDAVFV